MTHSIEIITEAFSSFIEGGRVVAVEQARGGHINQTYFVTHEDYDRKNRKYVMQCMNRNVFPHLEALMENVTRVSEHMQARCRENPDADSVRGYLHFIRTQNGATSFDSPKLGFWRMYRFINKASGKMIATTEHEAYSAGQAFGKFQALLADIPSPRLHETIKYFHDTRRRYEAFEEAVAKNAVGRLQNCVDIVEGLRELKEAALIVQVAAEQGLIPERVVHNDAKLSNVLLDTDDGHAVCVIDLDTCMPGLTHHDFGDLMRSICSNKDEDTDKPDEIEVRMDMFAALHAGYLAGSAGVLTDAEKALLPEAGIVLTLEVAVRFLGDYLAGDVYFGIKHPEHNLVRARAQLTLARKLIAALPELHRIASSVL